MKKLSKKEKDSLYEQLKAHMENKDKNNIKILDEMGNGAYGLIFRVNFNDKYYAGKLIKDKENEINKRIDLIREFKGTNIVKIIKIFDNIALKNKDNEEENYHFIVMENAKLKDLKNLIDNLYNHNKLILIIKSPFEGEVSNNLIRFLSYEIIKGLESLDRKNYYHFDIKPDNILICSGLIPKICDFSLLSSKDQLKKESEIIEKESDRNEEILHNKIEKTQDEKIEISGGTQRYMIPGGTPGYISPEYYTNIFVSSEVAKKQDYFALGATLYELKFGEKIIPGQHYHKDVTTTNYLIDLIQRAIDLLNSKKLLDKDFKDFLCSLIKYTPEERANFEEIYRNKWLNKNMDIISRCQMIHYHDENKLFMELNKSDFLNQTKNNLKRNRQRFIFNKSKLQI